MTKAKDIIKFFETLDHSKLELACEKLSKQDRDKLPDNVFALPGRRYPIHDIQHARVALSFISRYGSEEEKQKVRAAVKRKYPEIKVSGEMERQGANKSPVKAVA